MFKWHLFDFCKLYTCKALLTYAIKTCDKYIVSHYWKTNKRMLLAGGSYWNSVSLSFLQRVTLPMAASLQRCNLEKILIIFSETLVNEFSVDFMVILLSLFVAMWTPQQCLNVLTVLTCGLQGSINFPRVVKLFRKWVFPHLFYVTELAAANASVMAWPNNIFTVWSEKHAVSGKKVC